jgi:hypothetical protein
MSAKSILTLRDLQQHFVNNLAAKHKDPDFLREIEARNVPAISRFAIYCNNSRVSLIKTLANTYPVCQRLVGEHFFRAMIDPYLERYPSRSPNLNHYGSFLAEALVDSPFVLDLPYLIDVVRLEWDIHCILMASDERLFDWHTLSLIPNNRYTDLILHRLENSILMHSAFPIDRIWETNQIDFMGNDIVDLTEGEVYLFVGRSGFNIRICRLTLLEWTILNAIDGKRNLKALQTSLAGKVEEQAIIESLPTLIKAGYIAKFC